MNAQSAFKQKTAQIICAALVIDLRDYCPNHSENGESKKHTHNHKVDYRRLISGISVIDLGKQNQAASYYRHCRADCVADKARKQYRVEIEKPDDQKYNADEHDKVANLAQSERCEISDENVLFFLSAHKTNYLLLD